MKTKLIAGAAALAALIAAPAFAQNAPSPTPPAATAGGFSVQNTPIGTIMADPAGKAVLEKQLPPIDQYLDQIKDMTLAQVAPMSQGMIDDAKLKSIQADLDGIKK